MKPTRNIRAAIYARTSKEDEKREKLSIAQQLDDGKSLAAKHGWTLDDRHVFVDADVKGSLPARQLEPTAKKFRPSLSAMLDAVQRGEIDVVILRKRDRLSRQKLHAQLALLEWMQDRKVGIATTHETLPAGTDASGRFALTVILAAARLELEKITENVRASKAYAKRHGLKLSGASRQFGFHDGVPGKVTVDEEQAAVVREIYQRWNGGESLTSIARWLSKDHAALKCRHTGKNAQGWKWTQQGVKGILKNPHYAGLERDASGERAAHKLWPVVVDTQTWWQAQTGLRKRAGRQLPSPQLRLLSSVMKCGYCRQTLHSHPAWHGGKVVGTHWICPDVLKHPRHERPAYLRDEVVTAFANTLLKVDAVVRTKPDGGGANAVVERDEVREKMARLMEDWADGKVTDFERDAARPALQRRLDRASAAIAKAQASAPSGGDMKAWADSTLDAKNRRLRDWWDVRVFSDRVTYKAKFTDTASPTLTLPIMLQRGTKNYKSGTLLPSPMPAAVAANLATWQKAQMMRAIRADKPCDATLDWTKSPLSLTLDDSFHVRGELPTLKKCTACGGVKARSEYSKDKRKRDGLQTYCKECNHKNYAARKAKR